MRATNDNAARVRETRAEYVRRGLCPYCAGRRQAEPGREACPECRAERNRRHNERRQARIAAGLCTKCGRERDAEGRLCSRCRAAVLATHAIYYRRQRAEGACLLCGQAARPGRTYCESCAAEQTALGRERYRRMQQARATCPHTEWRIRGRVLEVDVARGVKIRWRQWCPACRAVEQHTIWADPARLVDVYGPPTSG